jgi:hypothetical protein
MKCHNNLVDNNLKEYSVHIRIEKMKQYISAILIPCLLLQFFGCYSYREVTIDEFKMYNGKDDVKIITEQAGFILNRDSTEKNKLYWVLNDSSIIMQEKTLMQDQYANSTAEKNKEIKFEEIKSVFINETDPDETEGLIFLGVIVLAGVTALLISISTDNFHIF